MKRKLKSTAERVLASPPARVLGGRIHRRQSLILAYHNITGGRNSPGDRSLHLSFDEFRRHLDEISTLRVISLQDALKPPEGGGASVVLTFDDAYAGAVTLALPEIQARGLPVTVFVAPAILDRTAMWWDLLAEPGGGVPRELRQFCLEDLAGDHVAIMATALARRWPVGPVREEFRIASPEEIDKALAGDGICLGVHSWSHPNLAASTERVLEEELIKPLEWLQARWPRHAVPHLAFPYGIPVGLPPAIMGRLGPGFLATGGWLAPETAVGRPLPRLTIPSGLSLEGFRARTRGLWRCR